MNRKLTTVCLPAIFLAVATTLWAHTQTFNEFEVVFNPNPNKGELAPASANQGCNNGQGQKKGCVNFPLNTIGVITFSISNQLRQCSDNGTHWVITKIELTHEGYLMPDGSTLSEKGIFGQAFPQWLEDAFPFADDPGAGVLFEAGGLDDGVTRVTHLNLNNNDSSAGVKDIWYKVTVSSCDTETATVLVTDPRFENTGSN